jgi:hypothetical protein
MSLKTLSTLKQIGIFFIAPTLLKQLKQYKFVAVIKIIGIK